MLKILPQMLILGSYRSVWQLVCKYIKNPKLRQAFSIQPLLVGGNPFDTTCIYSLIHYLERKHGIHFAMGGTQALVDALVKLMREEGINILLNTEVSDFLINNKNISGVRMSNDKELYCDFCISNMDPLFVYKNMIKTRSTWVAKIRAKYAKPSMGLFVLFFGSRKKYPHVEHHSIVLGKDFKGLLDSIFNKKELSKDISIYLHRPTATDQSFAPDGCDSFYALVPVPNLTAPIDWSVEAKILQACVLQRLDNTILPGIQKYAEHIFCMTPEDFKRDYNSEYGAGFSIAPLFYQSAWFRFHNQGEGLNNLFLTGAGTHPGAGLPGVISSAKVVEHLLSQQLSARLVEKDNGIPSI
jgi:phytoene desaturase